MKSIAAERRPLLYLLALLVPLALFTRCSGWLVPREGWNERWGPLVPHKTFPADCSLCHLPDTWEKLRSDFAFDHAKETGVELKGEHKRASCLRCHNDFGPVSAYVARGCQGCHLDPHRRQLGPDCAQCHDEASWRPQGLIAEHARTRFPLVGAHAAAACELCHERGPTGDFRSVSRRCDQCHREDMLATQQPDHRSAGWTTSCERCHVPTSWTGAGFIHGFFPLTGGHAITDCQRCHSQPDFGDLSPDCFSCHADDYARAPNHDSGNFSKSCQLCHTIDGWEGATIDHSFFPLEAGHALNDCSRCHTGGIGPRDDACNSCHADDFQRGPNHVAGNFSRNCEQCHTTVSWEGASIDHSFFPLEAGHALNDCSRCHTGGIGPLDDSCNACHADDFQRAPDHVALNFPRDCEDCHTIQRWSGATFRHTFPLRGEHNVSCTTCHNAGSTQSFSCFACHEHSRSRMDDKHREVGGYVYDSAECFRCHRNGKED